MHRMANASRGLWFLVRLNSDRLFVLGTILVGLEAGVFLGKALVRLP